MGTLISKPSLFLLLFLALNCERNEIVPDSRTKIEDFSHEGLQYRVIYASPNDIKLIVDDKTGKKLGSFENARAEARRRFGKKARAIMNAGIFEAGSVPTGLHIEDKKTLHPINLNAGRGNFFTQPNGVFSIDKHPQIRLSKSYAKKKRSPRLAVQSGPLLMKGRKIMKHFSKDNPSRKIRNGVCTKGKQAIFLISKEGKHQPNMHSFASAFKKLGCQNALYLDGTISQLQESKTTLGFQKQYGAFFVFL